MTEQEFAQLHISEQIAINNAIKYININHARVTINDVFYLSCGEFFIYGKGSMDSPGALDSLYISLYDGMGTMQRIITRRYNLLEIRDIIDILIKRYNAVRNPDLESKENENETLGETSL